MTISYKWSVLNLDRRTSDGFIQVAHWQCTGTDGDLTSSVYATCSFEDGDINIPYTNVTEADVLNWIWAGGVDKDATEAAVQAQIDLQLNPPVISGTPWAQPLVPPQFTNV